MFESNQKKVKILVVDDDAAVLSTLKRILEKKGYEIVPVPSPYLAMERVKTENLDLVITDLKMPDMDGVQLLYWIKQENPKLPVILVTAYSTIDTAVQAIKYGGFDYLQKPFSVDKIYDVVERCLNSKEKQS